MSTFYKLITLVLSISAISCASTKYNKINYDYSSGQEGEVAKAIIENAQKRGSLTNKEYNTLKICGPQHMSNLISNLEDIEEKKDFTSGIHFEESLLSELKYLNKNLLIYLKEYDDKEFVYTKIWEKIHSSYKKYLSNKLNQLIANKDYKKAINFAVKNNEYFDENTKSNIVNDYLNIFISNKNLENETIDTALEFIREFRRYADDQLISKSRLKIAEYIAGIKYQNRKQALDKISKIDNIFLVFNSNLSVFNELKMQREVIIDSFMQKLHIAKSINKSEYSTKKFDNHLNKVLSQNITIKAPYYTQITPYSYLIKSQFVKDGIFRDMSHYLEEAIIKKEVSKKLILITQVNSIKINKEPKEINTRRAEWTGGSFGSAMQMGLAYSGDVQHFEYTEERQNLNALILVSYALYDFNSGSILTRDSIEHEESYSSLQTRNLMAVGQDTIRYSNSYNYSSTGPMKKIPAGYRPPHVDSKMNRGTTGPLPANDSVREDLNRKVSEKIFDSIKESIVQI